MVVRRGITLHVVEREPEMLPFVRLLLRRWMDLGFEPVACRQSVEQILRERGSGASESLLIPRAVTDGGLVATDKLLYPSADLALRVNVFQDGAAPQFYKIPFDESAVGEVSTFLRWTTGAIADKPDLAWLPERILAETTRREPAIPPSFPRIEQPGIYRREHGCAVIRSRTKAIMLDPVAFWMPQGLRAPISIDGSIDAIFITHGHADHFNMASILAFGGNATIVVPPVPRPSILAPNDMLSTLRMFGLHALAPAWGSQLQFGDIQVDVLPFFGEQPVRDGDSPLAGLRNWGSCYRFTTPDFTAIALIDSGVDPLGDMADVVRASRDERGPVDFFLSSLPHFHCPFFFGLPQYYLTLPFDRLRSLFDQYVNGHLPSVTPGPDGIVEVCRAGRPRYYLPYGNGFEGPGNSITDVGMHIGEPPEPEVIRYLADRFAYHGIPTTPIGWNPGDWISMGGGNALRVAYSAATESLIS